MKKILSFFLAFAMLLCVFCVGEEANVNEEDVTPQPTAPVLAEDEILMHGYLSPYMNYYVGVPAEWALIGAGSTPDNIAQAEEISQESVRTIIANMNKDNDVLFAVSAAGETMVLTYGDAAGATNEALIDALDEFKARLSAKYVGIKFDNDCGSYELNEFSRILYIGATYNGRNIRQYYISSGVTMYIFTFTNVTKSIADTVLSTFNLR